VQNEILQLLASDVLRRILADVQQSNYYSIMLDETSDCSRHEQLAVCLRYCDAQLDIREVFTGFHDLVKQDAMRLFSITKNILTRYNLDINRCRGQCFDGAANVAGALNGLQAKVREIESRAVFVHCAAHSINLVTQDAISCIPAYRDALAMFGGLIYFVRDSLKRLRWFESLQQGDANGLRPYCPTRWILRESALTSALANYAELLTFMDEVSASDKSDAGAKAAGFMNQMSSFHAYFNPVSLQKIFTAIGTVNTAKQATSHAASMCTSVQLERIIAELQKLVCRIMGGNNQGSRETWFRRTYTAKSSQSSKRL
jgi:hypothetical protein